mgnify:FL=1
MVAINIKKEQLEELYINKNMSLREVASVLGISISTVYRKLLKYEIPVRSISEGKKGRDPHNKGVITKEFQVDKELLYNDYYKENMSLREICSKHSIAFKTLKKLFNKWGWETRTHEEQTTLHNKTVKRGKNFGQQNKNYHYIYTKVAFQTYEAKCEKCGYDKYLEVLEVHHIDGDRSNNVPENLMILCPTCHREITFGLESGKRY